MGARLAGSFSLLRRLLQHKNIGIFRGMDRMEAKQLREGFRELLKNKRIRAGLTQAQLAERIDTKQPYIASLESGSGCPTFETLAKLSEALNVSPRDLLPK